MTVWTFPACAAGGAAYAACLHLLAPEERQRALGIRAGVAREESVTARAVLRLLVGRRLRIAPREVRIHTGEHGKPTVAGVEFNVAHSRGQILIGVARELPVGVDLEWVDPSLDPEELAEAHFSPGERERLARARNPRGEFYRVWTAKEALLKAVGCGLLHPLDSFSVPPAEEPVCLRGEAVFVRELPVQAGWAAAVAIAGAAPRISHRQVPCAELERWLAVP